MLFNSFSFLIFLAGIVLAERLTPQRYRWGLLLVASFIFYGLWNAGALTWLALVTLVAYGTGLALERYPSVARRILAAALVADLGILFLLKYFNFAAEQLHKLLARTGWLDPSWTVPHIGWLLPAGLSFYTLSAASYMIDVYRRQLPAERHLGKLALFLAFFPKILAGPIERATRFLPQLAAGHSRDPERLAEGARLVLWGLFKKVVIADRLHPFVEAAFGQPMLATPVQLLVGIYFYAFQIYADFSGYTDIATGAAKMLGFDFAPNFRRPYLAQSTVEFWGKQRWHISLSTWFRDYLYIPMGGNRVGWARRYLNTMVVFLASGIWHAGLVGGGMSWSYLLWGALNGVYQWISMATSPLWKALGNRLPQIRDHWAWKACRIVWTFHLITFAWIFFRAASVSDAFFIISKIASNLSRLPMLVRFYDVQPEFVLSVALIALLMVVEVADEARGVWKKFQSQPVYVRWTVYYALLLLLVVLGQWGLAEFIYMQF